MTKKEKREPFFRVHLKNRLKDIPMTVVAAIYIAFCFATIFYCISVGNYRDIAVCIGFALVVPLVYIAEYTMRLKIPMGYLLIVELFMTGNLLGQAYNLYTTIPAFDIILHAIWSVVFSIMGIAIVKSLIGAPKSNGGALAYLLFGIGFCMLTSVMWEIYEFTGDSLFANLDMQEDTIVKSIHSFMLHNPYDHLHTFRIDGITQTVIHYANGETYVIEGGYLDIGLHDTMSDLIACFIASAVFCIIMTVDWFTTKKLYWFFIPESKKEYYKRGEKREAEDFVEVQINPVENERAYTEEKAAQNVLKDGAEEAQKEEIAEITE